MNLIKFLFYYIYQQMKNSNKDFKISVAALEKEFLCNICFNEIQDCYITRCGHIYCKNCIFQTINRHHRCPFCNIVLNENDIFKNYHFNTLRKIVNKQKQNAASIYLSKVFQQSQIIQNELMAPIEKIIKYNCKQSLLTYRKYIKQMYQCLEANQQRKQRQQRQNFKMKTQRQLIQQIHNFILPHLQNPIISPNLIPRSITICLNLPPPYIKSINLQFPLTATTPVGLILQNFQKSLKQNNIRLQHQNKKLSTLVFDEKFVYHIDDLIGQNIKNFTKNSIQLSFQKIKIVRNIECFSYKWFKGKQVNYFSCKECSINWICEVCKDYCHQKHTTILQLKDHIPNWACCYCVTKSDCQALNKNTNN